MKIFEDLDAFRCARDLIEEVYGFTQRFPATERYGLTSQMRRAAISIASNIAEGQGRLTPGEWRQMLSHARGSLFELQAQVVIAERLQFTDPTNATLIRTRIGDTARPLAGLIQYVRDLGAKTDNR